MSIYKGYTEQQKKATAKYKQKMDYVKLGIDLPREKRDRYKQHAQNKGVSLASLIMQLLDEDMKKSNEGNE